MHFLKSFSVAVILLFQVSLVPKSYSHPTHSISHDEDENPVVDLIDVAEKVLNRAKKHAKYQIRSDHGFLYSYPMDCAEILDKNSSSKSGIYEVRPRSRFVPTPIHVYCDMEDEGGAWTVIQRRGDFDSSKDYFYRDWVSYKNGFGDPSKDFWIGNDIIFSLANQRSNTLKFVLRDWEGNTTYATYDDFWTDDESHNYTMHVSGYRGTAGDGFSYTNGLPFTTRDRDHDKHASNCAVMFKAAWWYGSCHSSNLNGQYLKGAHESYADGVNWSSFRGNHYSLKDAVIKIRPKDFVKQNKVDLTPE